MEVTIQQYRSRIGRFLPKHGHDRIIGNTSRNYEDYPTITIPGIWYYILAFAIFTPVMISINQYVNIQRQEQSYNHPFYPAEIKETSTESIYSPGTVSTDLHSRFLLSYMINIFAASKFSMVTNYQSKYTNGNRKNQGIKIAHWNKGNAFLQNKMPEIRNIISGLHPHIIGISEANLHHNHDQNLVQIQDYTLHTCPTLGNPNLKTSRIVAYTHKSLVAKIRPDLMSSTYSSIWLEVGLPRHKRFLVCQTYREWQLLNQRDDTSSQSITMQMSRWSEFLDQWQRALSTGLEVHTLGDMNLNHLNWTDQAIPHSNQSYKLRDLISALFSQILSKGVTQCVRVATRHWPGQPSTGLDHYYTNRVDKISPVQTQHRGGSDHQLIFAVRYSRSIKSSPRYIRKRSYRNFKPEEFKEAIQSVSWLDVYLSENVNKAVELMSNKITSILDTMAPIRTVQVRTNYAPWLSQETKELMSERDTLQSRAAKSKSAEDWKKYKVLRNRINSRLKSEERNWQRIRISECGQNSAKVWKNVKDIINWKSSGAPIQLFNNGVLHNKPSEVADCQNQLFIDKVRLIRENMPAPVSDPLNKLRLLMSNRSCSFSLHTVHPDEVAKLITDLKNTNYVGLELIDTKII